jgi:hypothetical protein
VFGGEGDGASKPDQSGATRLGLNGSTALQKRGSRTLVTPASSISAKSPSVVEPCGEMPTKPGEAKPGTAAEDREPPPEAQAGDVRGAAERRR